MHVHTYYDDNIRAANNGRSTDNVRSRIGFVWSNPQMAGQFVRSFTLVRTKFRVSSFKYIKVQYYYYRCLSGPKWDMSEQKQVRLDNLTGASLKIIYSPVILLTWTSLLISVSFPSLTQGMMSSLCELQIVFIAGFKLSKNFSLKLVQDGMFVK